MAFVSTAMWAAIIGSIISLPVLAQDKKRSEARPGVAEKTPEKGKDKAKPAENFFPPWPTDKFEFSLGPIIGARARQTEYAGARYDTLSSEIGLGARVRGIPLIPSNPGLSLEPYASYTWGNRTQKLKTAELSETDSSGFQRFWYGMLARIYYKSFRYSLDLGRGKLLYDDAQFVDIQSTRIINDFGLLILPFLSSHYTLTLFSVKEGQTNHESIKELDQWLHARMAFVPMSFSLDLGPGQTQIQYSGQLQPLGPWQNLGTVSTSYLKAITSFNIIWKLGASGSAKYILSANKLDAPDLEISQLPNESLSENNSLSILPKGSLEASAFLGIHNLVGGFGIGWQLYYLELNIGANNKHISRDQGLVLSFEAAL